jgi:cobalt-zinc-cadmium efflux system outer membrane protein
MNRFDMRRCGFWLGWLVLFPCGLWAQEVDSVQSAALVPQASVVDQSNVQPMLRLDDVIREALEKNPEAQSALHTVKAMQRRVPQVESLPDPMASVGWAGNLAPFSVMQGDNSSYRGLTVSEQFPYPGKLKLRGQIASKEADSAQADYDAVRRRITVEVKTAYYNYFYYDRAIQTTERNKVLLEKLSKIAEARYRVGKAMQADVLRSQIEISLLIEKLTVLEQQRATAQARINVFLLRSPESSLPPAAEIEPATITSTLDELYTLAAEKDTAVLRDQKMVERGSLSVALAQREYRPDIGVSYMVQQRSDLPTMNGVTVSVNIPVFYKSKQQQGVAEASEDRISAEKMRDNRLNEVKFELKQDYLAAKASERLLTLYSKGVVPQSSLALESSMASYQVGTVDFLSLLANFSTLLNYEIDYYRQLADYQTALAQIEVLTGTDVTGPPLPATPVSDIQSSKEAK